MVFLTEAKQKLGNVDDCYCRTCARVRQQEQESVCPAQVRLSLFLCDNNPFFDRISQQETRNYASWTQKKPIKIAVSFNP